MNSPYETAHSNLKNFLLTSRANLYRLAQAIVKLIDHKERVYNQDTMMIETKLRREYLDQEWLGDLSKHVGYKAIDLLVSQHRLLLTAQNQARPRLLKPYTERFTNQYGLPYAYIL